MPSGDWGPADFDPQVTPSQALAAVDSISEWLVRVQAAPCHTAWVGLTRTRSTIYFAAIRPAIARASFEQQAVGYDGSDVVEDDVVGRKQRQ
jgi:hypothetical protein